MAAFLALILTAIFLFPMASAQASPDASPLATSGATPMPRPNVLVLHSYHPSYLWTRRIMEGLRQTMEASPHKPQLRVEYLDTKHVDLEQIMPELRSLYKIKYNKRRFACIVTSDDNALTFLRRNRDDCFRDTPVVFCGVNRLEPDLLRQEHMMTGVAENYDLDGTVALMLQLHPDTRHIAVISDNTHGGQRFRTSGFPELETRFRNITFVPLHNLPIKDLEAELNRLPPRSLVLFFSYVADPLGRALTLDQGLSLVTSHARVPVYSCWDTHIRRGVTGGLAVSGREQGRRAGEMINKILAGTPPGEIPVQRTARHIPMFDYRQLRRFGISRRALPENTVLLNEPQSFFYVYRYWILAIAIVLTIETLILVLLATNLIRRRRVENALRESERRYRRIFESLQDVYAEVSLDGTILEVSPSIEPLAGYKREEVIGRPVTDFYADQSDRRRLLETVKRRDRLNDYIVHFVDRDGRRVPCSLTIRRVGKDGAEPPRIIGTLRDVSERVEAERRLRESHDQLEQRVAARTAELAEANRTLEDRVRERTALAEARAAQLQAMALELTQAEQRERHRLSRVLHDHLQQVLVAARYSLSVLGKREGEEKTSRTAREVDALLREAITVSKSLAIELSPPILYDDGLISALQWLAQHMRERHGLEVVVDAAEGSEPADQDLAVFLFQAVRELLFNVVKHAETGRARVGMRRAGSDQLEIVVSDEGAGFDTGKLNAAPADKGFGVFSIRERLDLLGGTMQVSSAPGAGTSVQLTVPRAEWEGREHVIPTVPARPKVGHKQGVERTAVPEPEQIRILVGGSHPLAHEAFAAMLTREPDLNVVGTGASVEETVELAGSRRPHLVLVHDDAACIDGVEVVRRIRARWPDIGVVGLHTPSASGCSAEMTEAGANACLDTGDPPEALLSVIREHGHRVMLAGPDDDTDAV